MYYESEFYATDGAKKSKIKLKSADGKDKQQAVRFGDTVRSVNLEIAQSSSLAQEYLENYDACSPYWKKLRPAIPLLFDHRLNF